DPAGPYERGRLLGADHRVALGEGVDRQHLDAREVRLEQRLQAREHAIALPLLVADEADALAREAGDARGVRPLHLDRAGGVVELEARGHLPDPPLPAPPS